VPFDAVKERLEPAPRGFGAGEARSVGDGSSLVIDERAASRTEEAELRKRS
jgi:hypothetical protein